MPFLALLKLIPFRDYLWAAALVALITFGLYEHHHLIAEGEAIKTAEVNKASLEAQAEADARVAQLTADHVDEVASIKEVHEKQHQVDSALHDSDAVRLRQYDAYRRAHPPVGSSGAGPGADTVGTDGIGGDDIRFTSLEQVALRLAAAGRNVKSALVACMADRADLTGK